MSAGAGDFRVRAARADDSAEVLGLLRGAGLPTAGVPAALADFLVAEASGRLLGVVGLEVYGGDALLRSAVVAPAARGRGIGAALVARLLEQARSRGIRDVYLLTTTAEEWFSRFGFARARREVVPPSLHASEEFQGACPASAVVMRATLR